MPINRPILKANFHANNKRRTQEIILINSLTHGLMSHVVQVGLARIRKVEDYKKIMNLLDLALGIDVEILFAPFAKRLEQKARSNAQKLIPIANFLYY
ncbi:MAG: hypothetical protein JWQ25_2965 [Daejeonella sp.]|nr:hypothetical protein [Daejeonella sp.]